MKFKTFSIALILLNYYMNLEFILIRHGPRSPNKKVKYEFKYYEENKPGYLTEQGFMESIELAKKLKLSKLINLNNENSTIFVSHYKRCTNTAEAYLIGMNLDLNILKEKEKIYFLNKETDSIFNNISSQEKSELWKKNSLIQKNMKIIDMLWDNLKQYNFLNLISNLCINCNLDSKNHYEKLKLLKTWNSIITCINHNKSNNNLDIPINFLLELKKSAFIFYDLLYLRNKDTIKKISNDFLYIIGNKFFSFLSFEDKLINQKFIKKNINFNLNSDYFLFFGHDANLIAFLKIYFDKDQFTYFKNNIPKFNSYIQIKLIENNFSNNILFLKQTTTNTKYFIKVIINEREIFTNKCFNMNCSIENFYKIINEFTY